MALFLPTLEELARHGVHLDIGPDSGLFPSSLESLVRIAVQVDSHITIHSGNLFPQTLVDLAKIGGKHLTIRTA